jgi:hypothetical protein
MPVGDETVIRWWVPVLLPALGIAYGVVLGAATNAVNGAVSPRYFRVIMGWRSDIWRTSVHEGMFEGGALGLLLGIIVAISFAASTRLRGNFGMAAASLFRAGMIALGGWVLGGLIAMALATSFQKWYSLMFIEVPKQAADRVKYAWVGGSIWGVTGGAILGAAMACMWLHSRWKRQRSRAFEVLPASS